MAYQKLRHDIGITNVGTDGSGTAIVGMMLAKDKGQPVWHVYDGKFLADQFFTNSPSQEYTDPEEEILLSQSDWRAGFGLEVYDSNDSKRYFSSIGADLRFRGMMIAGQLASSTVLRPTTTVPAYYDFEFDEWTDATTLTHWTVSSTAVTTDRTTGQYSGAYCARVGGLIYQDVYNWTTGFQGKTITPSAYFKTGAGSGRVGIDDGIAGTVWSAWQTGGTWTVTSTAVALSASATQCRFCIQTTGVAVDVDLASCTGSPTIAATALGVTNAFAEFNDKLYIPFGKYLAKLNAAGSALTPLWEFPAAVTDLEPFVNSELYIPIGLSNAYWYCNTAEAFNESFAGTATFKFMKTVHSASPTMWGNSSTSTIRSRANPSNTTLSGTATIANTVEWSGTTQVGSNYYDITDLTQKSGALYIMKEDMPYYLNSSAQVQNDLAPELTACATATSGANVDLWKSNLYIPAGAQALLRTDGITNEFINPASYCTNLADFNGRVMATAHDDEYEFIAVDNLSDTTKVEILAGRDETVDGATSFRWHPIAELTLAGVQFMFVSNIVQKRLWIVSTDSTQPLYYIPLPTGYGDVVNDSNRSFKTGTYFITPYLHGGFKNNLKSYIKITLTMGHVYDADIYFDVSYEKLGDTTWTSIGSIKGTAANRTASAFIPVDGSSNKPTSPMMRFKITAVTDDTTKTPILLQYTVSAVLYPTIKTVYYGQIVCAEDIVCKNGMDKNMKDTIITTLDNARNATWPVSIRDPDGNTKTVKLLPLPKNLPRFAINKDEEGREKERIYNVMMQEIALS